MSQLSVVTWESRHNNKGKKEKHLNIYRPFLHFSRRRLWQAWEFHKRPFHPKQSNRPAEYSCWNTASLFVLCCCFGLLYLDGGFKTQQTCCPAWLMSMGCIRHRQINELIDFALIWWNLPSRLQTSLWSQVCRLFLKRNIVNVAFSKSILQTQKIKFTLM